MRLSYPTGIVISEGVEIGRNCTIYQQVTFGGAQLGDAQNNLYPKVVDNAVFFAGAKIIGNVPDGCTVVGVPGHILNEKRHYERA